MTSRIALVASALLLAACMTPRARSDGDAAGVARAERAFAASAQTVGVKAAFLQVLASDATLFRPGPVNGRAVTSAEPDPPIRLEWQPQRVSVGRAGDLGYSTGPYRLTADAKPGQPGYGQFMTVWKRGPLDRWEVLIDLGIRHPAATGWDAALDVIAPDEGPRPQRTLVAAEAAFARTSATDDLAAAYRAEGSTRLRLLRDGLAPIASDDVARLLPDGASRWTWTMTDNGISRDGDLAWVMGRYRSTSSGAGHYVRVWRAERGDWKILADVVAPSAEAVH